MNKSIQSPDFFVGFCVPNPTQTTIIRKTMPKIMNLFAFFPSTECAIWIDENQKPISIDIDQDGIQFENKRAKNMILIKGKYSETKIKPILELINEFLKSNDVSSAGIIYYENGNISVIRSTDLGTIGFDYGNVD